MIFSWSINAHWFRDFTKIYEESKAVEMVTYFYVIIPGIDWDRKPYSFSFI